MAYVNLHVIYLTYSGLFLGCSFSFIPASYAIAVVKEREVSAKHQQLISGDYLSSESPS
jgi:hypothetical protein